MARRRRNRRYRRSRLTVPFRILSFFLICGAIVAALILFFKVQTITVAGNSRYTTEEILAVTDIEQGENLFLINKYAVASAITGQLPYVESVQIRRVLPDGIVIEVQECEPVAAVIQGSDAWLISGSGKLLERVTESQSASYVQIRGCELLLPTVAAIAQLPSDGNITREELLSFLEVLQERGMLDQAEWIDCSDPETLVMRYAGRFDVELRYNADFNKKMRALEEIIGYLEDNETGTIILTMSDKSSFKPHAIS